MRNCPECNTANKDHAIYCRNCGRQLQKDNLKDDSNTKSYNKIIAIAIVILIIIVAAGAFAVNYMNQQIPVDDIEPIAVNNTTTVEKPLDDQNSSETDNLTEIINQTNETEDEINLTSETNNTTQIINKTNNNNNSEERTKILGLVFTIPDGYWEESFNTTTIEGDDESSTINAAGKFYQNKQGDTISIIVTEIANGDPLTEEYLEQYGEESGYDITEMTINGKDGYYYVDDLEEPIWYDFIYLKYGKIVNIAVSNEIVLEEVVR